MDEPELGDAMRMIGSRPLTGPEKTKRWLERNRDKARAGTRRWKLANPEMVRANKRKWLAVPLHRMRHTLGQAKRRAGKAGTPFSITLDDLLPLPEFCPVFGTRLNYAGTGGRGFIDNSPSIDRVEAHLGYVPGNVRIVCWRANRLKADGTMEELIKILSYVERHRAEKCN